MSKREFIWPVRVYYEDTDVAGVVYYANYLKFYERARTEWLRSLGWEQDVLIEKGLAFAVAEVNIRYFKAARFNDKLLVKSQIIKSGKASMVFKQQIYIDTTVQNTKAVDNKKALLNEATIKVACVDMKSMTPRPVPNYLKEEIASDWC